MSWIIYGESVPDIAEVGQRNAICVGDSPRDGSGGWKYRSGSGSSCEESGTPRELMGLGSLAMPAFMYRPWPRLSIFDYDGLWW